MGIISQLITGGHHLVPWITGQFSIVLFSFSWLSLFLYLSVSNVGIHSSDLYGGFLNWGGPSWLALNGESLRIPF